MKHVRRRHVILPCIDQTKNSLPKQAKVSLIRGLISGWPKPVLLCYRIYESSLRAKQQFPRGSCQSELSVFSGAHLRKRRVTETTHGK